MTEAAQGSERLVIRAGGRSYAIAVGRVAEVVRALPTAELPRVPSYVLGAAQFRSEVIPVLDLAGRLGLIAEPFGPKGRLVIVNGPNGRAAFEVAEVVGLWRSFESHGDRIERAGEVATLLDLDRAIDWRAG
jgi:chemotaxis signal transduction protein